MPSPQAFTSSSALAICGMIGAIQSQNVLETVASLLVMTTGVSSHIVLIYRDRQ